MIRTHKLTLAVALVSTLVAFGCSSSSSSKGGSSGGTSACVVSAGPAQSCTSVSGLNASQKKSSDDACTQHGGTAAGSCPTDNQIGCCSNPQQGGYTSMACYYKSSGDAGTLGGDAGMSGNYEQSCTQSGGTWTTP